MKRVLKRLKNKKGMLSIEYTISLMICLMLIAFLVDFGTISVKRIQLTKYAQSVVRQIKTQSGLSSKMPTNFAGSETSYITVNQLSESFQKKLEGLNLPTDSDSSKIKIEGITYLDHDNEVFWISSTFAEPFKFEYQTPFTVTISVKYPWTLFGQFVTNSNGELVVSSSGYTEYNHNADVWEGETR